MPKRLFIRIDLDRLAVNMSKEEGRSVSQQEARDWLVEAGFVPRGDGWIVNEPDLGQLDPSEVQAVEDVLDEPA